jgi:mRNA interferase RelE/StbE
VTYRIELTKAARQALTELLPEPVAVACWEFIRGPLAENPYRVGKPLRNHLKGRYSARRGEFRVIYQIFDDRVVVRVIHIAHRRDVYRR